MTLYENAEKSSFNSLMGTENPAPESPFYKRLNCCGLKVTLWQATSMTIMKHFLNSSLRQWSRAVWLTSGNRNILQGQTTIISSSSYLARIIAFPLEYTRRGHKAGRKCPKWQQSPAKWLFSYAPGAFDHPVVYQGDFHSNTRADSAAHGYLLALLDFDQQHP